MIMDLLCNEQTCSLQLSDSVHLWVSWVRQAIHWTFVRKGIIQVKSLLTSHTLTALGQSQKQLASEEHDRSIGLFILSYELLLFPKRGSVDSLKMQQDRTEDRAELVNNKYSFLECSCLDPLNKSWKADKHGSQASRTAFPRSDVGLETARVR